MNTNQNISEQMSITGGDIQHYVVGQSLTLVCMVQGLLSPPVALYWEKGNKVELCFEVDQNIEIQ